MCIFARLMVLLAIVVSMGAVASAKADDCNTNGIPDLIDIAGGTSDDCNSNAIPDECDIAEQTSDDCDSNGIPDECTTLTCPPIEMVIILDVSTSMVAEVYAICDGANAILSQVDLLNSNGPPYIDVDVMTIGSVSTEACVANCDVGTTGLRAPLSCSCCTTNSIAEMYGTTLP